MKKCVTHQPCWLLSLCASIIHDVNALEEGTSFHCFKGDIPVMPDAHWLWWNFGAKVKLLQGLKFQTNMVWGEQSAAPPSLQATFQSSLDHDCCCSQRPAHWCHSPCFLSLGTGAAELSLQIYVWRSMQQGRTGVSDFSPGQSLHSLNSQQATYTVSVYMKYIHFFFLITIFYFF